MVDFRQQIWSRAQNGWQAVAAVCKRIFEKQSRRYWIGALLTLIATTLLSNELDHSVGPYDVRYRLHQLINEIQWRPLMPRYTRVVMIGDDEHYDRSLEYTTPTNRAYLAHLVDKLAADGADVIALDFDVRLGTDSETGTTNDITPSMTVNDVKTLVHSIIAAADAKHGIVLSKTIAFSDAAHYRLLADIYQPFGICTQLLPDGTWKNPGLPPEFVISPTAASNISCGYIALPYDMQLKPPRVLLNSGLWLDSFSLAIAKLKNEQLAGQTNAYYSGYIPQSVIESSHIVVPARRVLSGDLKAEKAMHGNLVIVGGGWHMLQKGWGEVVDTQDTPVGPIVGAVIHENFVEAILDSRVVSYVPDWLLRTAEVIFSAAAAICFALYSRVSTKIAVFVTLCAALIAIQWMMLQMFGMFFDGSVPLLGLGVHSLAERLLGHD